MNIFWTIVLALVVGWLLLGFLGSMTEQRNREAVGSCLAVIVEVVLFGGAIIWLIFQFVR